MQILQHDFTKTIINILNKYFPGDGDIILNNSQLLQYINLKTKAANRGSKSRASFANHYAIYVLIEDYLQNNFHIQNGYEDYEGAQYTTLLMRQRELPFGRKLQNHALNHRLNEEFKKYFRTSDYLPIIRDSTTNRYWINENLLKIQINDQLIVMKYMECIEEVINIPELMLRFNQVLEFKRGIQVLEEIVLQNRIEFNMEDEAVGDEE